MPLSGTQQVFHLWAPTPGKTNPILREWTGLALCVCTDNRLEVLENVQKTFTRSALKKIDLLYFWVCVYTYVWGHAPVGVDAYRNQKRASNPWELDLQTVVSLLMWVPGLKFHSSARGASALSHWAHLSLLKKLKLNISSCSQDHVWNRTNRVCKNRHNQHPCSTFWSSSHIVC